MYCLKITFVQSEGESLAVEYLFSVLKPRGHKTFLAFFTEVVIKLLTDRVEYNRLKSEVEEIALRCDWDDVTKRELTYLIKSFEQ